MFVTFVLSSLFAAQGMKTEVVENGFVYEVKLEGEVREDLISDDRFVNFVLKGEGQAEPYLFIQVGGGYITTYVVVSDYFQYDDSYDVVYRVDKAEPVSGWCYENPANNGFVCAPSVEFANKLITGRRLVVRYNKLYGGTETLVFDLAEVAKHLSIQKVKEYTPPVKEGYSVRHSEGGRVFNVSIDQDLKKPEIECSSSGGPFLVAKVSRQGFQVHLFDRMLHGRRPNKAVEYRIGKSGWATLDFELSRANAFEIEKPAAFTEKVFSHAGSLEIRYRANRKIRYKIDLNKMRLNLNVEAE